MHFSVEQYFAMHGALPPVALARVLAFAGSNVGLAVVGAGVGATVVWQPAVPSWQPAVLEQVAAVRVEQFSAVGVGVAALLGVASLHVVPSHWQGVMQVVSVT